MAVDNESKSKLSMSGLSAAEHMENSHKIKECDTRSEGASDYADRPPEKFGAFFCCISLVAQLVFAALTASFLFGFNVAALNTSKPYIILEFKWCGSEGTVENLISCDQAKTYGTLINGGVFVGAALGALVGGRLLIYGRRFCLMLTCLLFVIGDIMSIAAEGFYSLLIARLVVGVAVGFSSVIVGVWVAENSPKETRGFWGVLIQLAITVGILVANLLGLAFGNLDTEAPGFYPSYFQRVWWRFMLGVGIIPAALGFFLILMVYKYDTPHFLIEKGMRNTAKSLLSAIYNKEDVDAEFIEVSNAIEEMKILEKQSLSFCEAMKIPVYRNVILIGCILSMGQQLTGINVMISNSNLLYKAAGLNSNLMTIVSVVLTTVNMLMTFPPIFLIDKLGRKTLLVVGTAGQTLFLLPGLIASWVDPSSKVVGWIAIGSTYGYIICFAVAYGPVLWVYLFEIFPAEVKKTASGLAVAMNWVGAIIMVLPSDYYLNAHSGVVFTLFTVLCGLVFLFILLFAKETKGRSIDDSPYFENKGRKYNSKELNVSSGV